MLFMTVEAKEAIMRSIGCGGGRMRGGQVRPPAGSAPWAFGLAGVGVMTPAAASATERGGLGGRPRAWVAFHPKEWDVCLEEGFCCGGSMGVLHFTKD